jgi:NAD(P)H dehydrogenase (quinone)
MGGGPGARPGPETSPPFDRESFVITGPESLTHTEIATRLSAVLNRTVSYIDLPPEALAARLTAQGLPAQFAADVAALSAEVAEGALADTTTAVPDLTGHQPRTFGQFLADNQDALRAAAGAGVIGHHRRQG